jgi:polyisoprenoid-binding protein YceI
MSRKTTAALIAALGINFALAGAAITVANLNKPTAFDPASMHSGNAADITTVAGTTVQADVGDVAVPLKAAQLGGNTRITFRCGKTMPQGREVHEGTWDGVGGAVLYRPESQQLVAIEAVFDTRSLRTDAVALTSTVTTKEKWFDIDNHPQATFRCNDIRAAAAEETDYTHELVGTFELNGIEKPIVIPATLTFAGPSLIIDASFVILRSDYDVDKRSSSLAGSVGGVVSEVDDEVHMTVRVSASPDSSILMQELAQLIESQQDAIGSLQASLEQVQGQLAYVAEQSRAMRTEIDGLGYGVVKEVDLSQIPDAFADAVPTTRGPVGFDMVLVQGGADRGIDAFYMAKHEVTWGMLTDWLYSAEVKAAEAAIEIKAGLRPTPLWGTLAEQFHVSDKSHPAMGMTRLTAEAFCTWLSEKTGRKYRLPTREEWIHALELGGGVPNDLDAAAWHAGNVAFDNDDLSISTSPVGSKAPNALGIHDMLGSVAEWVTQTGTERYVVGGSINTPPDQITANWRAVEDIDVWSASYPNLPKSRYWYVDYYYTGIRLVCEPASVAANPPPDGSSK